MPVSNRTLPDLSLTGFPFSSNSSVPPPHITKLLFDKMMNSTNNNNTYGSQYSESPSPSNNDHDYSINNTSMDFKLAPQFRHLAASTTPANATQSIRIGYAQTTPSRPDSSHTFNTQKKPLLSSSSSSNTPDNTQTDQSHAPISPSSLQTIINDLQTELTQTQFELVKAVTGWRDDRTNFTLQISSIKESNSVKTLKSEMVTERRRLRGMAAKLQNRVGELEKKIVSVSGEYERRIEKQRIDVLEHENRNKLLRRDSIKESVKLSDAKSINNAHGMVEKRDGEIGELKNAIALLLENNEDLNERLRLSSIENAETNATVIELRNQLNESIRAKSVSVVYPSRPPPPPPPLPAFDFEKYSDTRITQISARDTNDDDDDYDNDDDYHDGRHDFNDNDFTMGSKGGGESSRTPGGKYMIKMQTPSVQRSAFLIFTPRRGDN